MVERQTELKRRYHRKGKMKKLKAKLGTATAADREKILYKIKRLSPWWTEASLTQGTKTVASATPSEPKKSAPKPKAPPKPKPDKK